MIYDSRFTIRPRPAAAAANPQSAIRNPQSPRGVALIVTLIMLAVITFMATTFLVLSRRERNSVSTNTDQTTARFTADTALERAKVQLLAGIIASTNDQNFDLMVPTNFYNPLGFDPAAVDYRTNVNYSYTIAPGKPPLTALQQQQNIANLLYDPRPPVFITNTKVTNDFRYYLDLNRNGLFDDSGSISNVTYNVSGTLVTNGNAAVVGDPQWIGVLQFPDRPHSADNKFLSRWTYIVLPSGKTLDVNYLHNQALNTTLGSLDGFARNQGVGTWEINLAAFLADLNTNVWYANPSYYSYNRASTGFPNSGLAFDDARTLLTWRYGPPYGTALGYGNQMPASAMFANGAAPFVNDNIDQYSDGPFMTGIRLSEALFPDQVNSPWAGADNTNHFFTHQDFFDPNKSSPAFVGRLQAAGVLPDTYNRYTFYRMLAQLGPDSSPPAEDKININYRNVTNGLVVAGMETNLIAWTPLEFFTNSAARMFQKLNLRDRDGNLITVTNIPIWPATNNYYTPAVHRILQLAANVFEATTNSLYPCIYRPTFSSRGTPVTNVFIKGYELVNGPDNSATLSGYLSIPLDVTAPADQTTILAKARINNPTQHPNVYGAPWVIGTKKGLPNLNQVAMQSVSQMTRKLLVYRPTTRTGWAGYQAKQMLVVGVSNSVAVEVWNSYNTNYPRPLFIQVDGNLSAQITNNQGINITTTFPLLGTTNSTLLATGLRPPAGAASAQPVTGSFVVPLQTNVVVLPDSVQIGSGTQPATWSTLQWNALPWNNATNVNWGVNLTNNLRCYIMDGGSAGRIVDYVQLAGLNTMRDLVKEAVSYDSRLNVWKPSAITSNVWWVSAALPMSSGAFQQIQISVTPGLTSDTDWTANGVPSGNKANAINYFYNFLTLGTVSSNIAPAPFSPTAKVRQMLLWEANDPLVHYLADDLFDQNGASDAVVLPPNAPTNLPPITSAMYRLNERFSPWGGNGPKSGSDPTYVDPHMFDTALKDPLVMASDNWDFPTNKFPNVGWLGRVHRGTPWQTVYMKAADILNTNALASNFVDWQGWSSTRGNPLLASNIAPVMDRQLFEVFTTGISDNGTRGQLSINQTNLAAWSAVLSGVIVLTNDPVLNVFGSAIINPAGVYSNTAPFPALVQIVQGINNTRTNYSSQTFTNLGDILATPQLSDASPYLNITNLQTVTGAGISDEVLERIPQQVMSLLTISHSPRFVTYVYGQTLHPANNSIVIGGPFNGLCTNYQVTAETAARAVIRVDGAPTKPHVVVEQYNVLPPN